MDHIIPALLVINPFIPGLYSLLDYIGYIYNSTTIRIAYTSARILINLIYIVLYIYIMTFMMDHSLSKGYAHDRKTKLIFTLISSIILITIFLLRYYSFKGISDLCKRVKKIKNNQDSLLLINIEKTLILVSFLFILYFIYDCYQSGKKFMNGENLTSIRIKSLYYTLGYSLTLLILKLFELNSLVKEDVEQCAKPNYNKNIKNKENKDDDVNYKINYEHVLPL